MEAQAKHRESGELSGLALKAKTFGSFSDNKRHTDELDRSLTRLRIGLIAVANGIDRFGIGIANRS